MVKKCGVNVCISNSRTISINNCSDKYKVSYEIIALLFYLLCVSDPIAGKLILIFIQTK